MRPERIILLVTVVLLCGSIASCAIGGIETFKAWGIWLGTAAFAVACVPFVMLLIDLAVSRFRR
jgi:hypothetical protein